MSNFANITVKSRNEALFITLYPQKPNFDTGEMEDFDLEDYLEIGLPWHAGIVEDGNPESFIRSVDQSPNTDELKERYWETLIRFQKTKKWPSNDYSYWRDRLTQAVKWALQRLQNPHEFAENRKRYERWKAAPKAQPVG